MVNGGSRGELSDPLAISSSSSSELNTQVPLSQSKQMSTERDCPVYYKHVHFTKSTQDKMLTGITTDRLVVKRVSFTRNKQARQEGSHTFIDDCSPVLAVQGCTLYDVVLSVSPVQALCGIVDGQAVGPE